MFLLELMCFDVKLNVRYGQKFGGRKVTDISFAKARVHGDRNSFSKKESFYQEDPSRQPGERSILEARLKQTLVQLGWQDAAEMQVKHARWVDKERERAKREGGREREKMHREKQRKRVCTNSQWNSILCVCTVWDAAKETKQVRCRVAVLLALSAQLQ